MSTPAIPRPANWPKWVRDPLPVDWPEDAAADPDNGCYMNNCFYCRVLFFGNKRRPVCKLCSEAKDAELAGDNGRLEGKA